jgi:hypothetical protein
MFQGTFNAMRGNQMLERNLEVFMSRTATTLLQNLKKYTPKRSGKAAAAWRKNKVNKFDSDLNNAQPYVPRLDKGYSKQAPSGFYKPAARDTKRTNKGRFYK